MHYDLTIIGGGMVGASLAMALQKTSLRVALIDAAPHTMLNDPRLIALTEGSCSLLKNIGLWPALLPHATPIKQLHVSHRGHFGITRIHAAELNLETLGHLIPATYINTALDQQLSGVDIIRPATLQEIISDDNGYSTLRIKIGDEIKTLQTKFIIGADGTHSTVRELLNIPTKTIDYQQSAIVTITELSRDHQNIAYERFLKHGAIAMLPLTEQRSATIWTASNEKIAELMQLNDDDFVKILQKEFGYRLGRFKRIQQRHQYPLKFIIAKENKKQNTILIGNAAHTVHPIAAQGLNLAFYEIAELAEYFYSNPNADTLEFSRANTVRWNETLSHQLTQLFSTDITLFSLARQSGMLALDACQSAKRLFMQKTLGKTGKIPLLLQEKEYHENHDTGY
jgi:2-octaprenyl-6-methoxyphenol hydroxylase